MWKMIQRAMRATPALLVAAASVMLPAPVAGAAPLALGRAAVPFVADTTPPSPPIIITPVLGGLVTGLPVIITGSAEPLSTVTVWMDGSVRGTAPVDGAGDWTFTVVSAQTMVTHVLQVSATDQSGNISALSSQVIFMLFAAPTTTSTTTPTSTTTSTTVREIPSYPYVTTTQPEPTEVPEPKATVQVQVPVPVTTTTATTTPTTTTAPVAPRPATVAGFEANAEAEPRALAFTGTTTIPLLLLAAALIAAGRALTRLGAKR